MADASSPPPDRQRNREGRMSFGDHLEELRRCLLRGLVGVVIAVAVALFFATDLLAFILKPLLVVLHAHGQRPEVMALSPPETFVVYLKIGFLTGLILAMPWLLYQLWVFVAAGLYRHEQKFARTFVPLIVGLFFVGVAFLYGVVLPIVLNFFITFSNSVRLPDLSPSWLQKLVVAVEELPPTTQPVMGSQSVSLLPDDPPQPGPGAVWVNTRLRELRVQTDQGLLVTPLKPAASATAITSQFSLQFYVSFVLSLAFAFGLAFELPMVVVFLSLVGIVTATQMAKARRYVIFGIVVAAAVLTPPDVLSMILLAIPMLFLFEGGLWTARLLEGRRKSGAAG
ncbi:MAG: twin-arginine translocase subunit TatC [Planctomycetota bacterium]